MGFVFSKSVNENMKNQQEFMLMNSRLQVRVAVLNDRVAPRIPLSLCVFQQCVSSESSGKVILALHPQRQDEMDESPSGEWVCVNVQSIPVERSADTQHRICDLTPQSLWLGCLPGQEGHFSVTI